MTHDAFVALVSFVMGAVAAWCWFCARGAFYPKDGCAYDCQVVQDLQQDVRDLYRQQDLTVKALACPGDDSWREQGVGV